MRRTRTTYRSLLPSLVSLLLALLLTEATGAGEVNRIILRVNDQIASLFDYQNRRARRIRGIQRADLEPQRRQELLAAAGEHTLQEIFDELLMLSRASQLGIEVTEQDVARAIEQTKESFGIESEEDFQMALAQSGMTLQDLEKQTRDSILMRTVMSQEVHPRIQLQEEDLRRHYQANPGDFTLPERRRLHEVVVLESSGATAQELARLAGEIRSALEAGGKPQEVVEPYAAEGLSTGIIELGWTERGDLDPALEKAAWELEVGGYSEPVAARGGLHILYLADREEARLRPFTEVREEIEASQRDRLFDREIEEYFRELEEQSYIIVDAPPEAAAFRTRSETSPRRGVIQGLDDVGPSLGGGMETEAPPAEDPESDRDDS